MKLNPDKLLEKIRSLNIKSTSCGHNNSNVETIIVEMREFDPTDMISGRAKMPLITTTCLECGTTTLFNAIKLGIVNTEGKINSEYINQTVFIDPPVSVPTPVETAPKRSWLSKMFSWFSTRD